MLKKFPFGDSLLKEFEIVNPESAKTFSFSTLVSLARRFQFGPSEFFKLDMLWVSS